MALLSPIWKVDLQRLSEIALNLFGNENLKIEGNHILEFIPRKSRRTFVKILSTMLNEVMVHNLEIKLNRIDKTEFIGEISASQIKAIDGKIKAYIVDIRDISERKDFERQLSHSEKNGRHWRISNRYGS